MRWAIATAGLFVSACASGPPPGGPAGPGGPSGGPPVAQFADAKMTRPVALMFTGFDADHDFMTTADESNAGLQIEFARADADRSGSLTGFEYVDWSTLALGDRTSLPDFRSLDPDFSNSVGAPEFLAAFRREFDRMDANKDGFLTRSEMLLDAPQRQMGPGGRSGPPGGGGPRGPGGGRGPGGRGPGGGGP